MPSTPSTPSGTRKPMASVPWRSLRGAGGIPGPRAGSFAARTCLYQTGAKPSCTSPGSPTGDGVSLEPPTGSRQRPYRVECSGPLPNAEAMQTNRKRAQNVRRPRLLVSRPRVWVPSLSQELVSPGGGLFAEPRRRRGRIPFCTTCKPDTCLSAQSNTSP